MAAITAAGLRRITENAYKRVDSKTPIPVDVKKRPWIKMLDSMKESTTFEGGAIVYPIVTTISDPGVTWVGDDEIEATTPDISYHLEYGYANLANPITIQHDELFRMGFSVVPNGMGGLDSRVTSKNDAYKITNYVQSLVKKQSDRHDMTLDVLCLGTGASDPSQPVGLFGILNLTNSTGTVGGLDRATNPFVRHYVDSSISSADAGAGGDLRVKWTKARRTANLFSSSNGVDGEIDFFMAGQRFFDVYTKWGELNNYRVNRDSGSTKGMKYDFAIPDTAVHFEGIPVIHNPTFDTIGTTYTSVDATNICVGINSATWKFKTLVDRYRVLTSPADPPKQRISRFDIDSTFHIACVAPASNMILALNY